MEYPSFFATKSTHAIYPKIYVPKWMYQSLHSKNPDPISVASLLHEQVHIKRQYKMGLFKYSFLYIVSRSFRFEVELLAIKPQMEYLYRQNIVFDIKKRAQYLSGSMYGWCTTYNVALSRLRKLQKDLSKDSSRARVAI